MGRWDGAVEGFGYEGRSSELGHLRRGWVNTAQSEVSVCRCHSARVDCVKHSGPLPTSPAQPATVHSFTHLTSCNAFVSPSRPCHSLTHSSFCYRRLLAVSPRFSGDVIHLSATGPLVPPSVLQTSRSCTHMITGCA